MPLKHDLAAVDVIEAVIKRFARHSFLIVQDVFVHLDMSVNQMKLERHVFQNGNVRQRKMFVLVCFYEVIAS